MSEHSTLAKPSLTEMWAEHTAQEFVHQDVDATMRTMVGDPHVIHVPVATGGRGARDVRDFYAGHFIRRMPGDVRLDLLSRTADADRVVDEMLFSFTHDVDMPWMLPGVAPTGRKVAIPLVAIVAFHDGKVESEHIYWDQASVLAQVGLLPSAGLPVLAGEQAKALLEPAAALNTLLTATDHRRRAGDGCHSPGSHVAPARVAPAQIAHIFLMTRDLPRLRAWYLTVFGGQATFESESLCLLSFDREHHRIAIGAFPGVVARPEGTHVGTHHCAFTYGSLDDLLHTYRRLKRQRIEPYWTINHGITTSMYYRDPDGNRIELQIDNFATAEEVQAFMAGPFRDNPVGVIFEPEELVRLHENGQAVDALRHPPKLPPGITPQDMLRM